MERISNVLTRGAARPAEQTFTPVVEPEEIPVRFPTPESWYAALAQRPEYYGPRDYCKYGCGGAGYFRRDVPVDHKLFGKVLVCQCKRDEMNGVQLAKYAQTLTDLERASELDSWGGEDRQALGIIKKYLAQKWGMCVLHGAVGVGKTWLVTALVNECLKRGVPAAYKVVPQMLEDLRGGYEPDADYSFEVQLADLQEVQVLVLDEWGRHKRTDWAEQTLFALLDARYREWDRKLTVLVTNDEPNPQDAVWSRFRDAQRGGAWVRVRGRDVRGVS